MLKAINDKLRSFKIDGHKDIPSILGQLAWRAGTTNSDQPATLTKTTLKLDSKTTIRYF
jgi:hypothetical protein